MIKEEWLFPNAVVPVDVETTAALVAEIHRLIGVVGGMALAQPEQEPVAWAMLHDNGHFIDCLTLDELREAMIESQHMVLVRSGVRIVDLQTHIENFDGEDR